MSSDRPPPSRHDSRGPLDQAGSEGDSPQSDSPQSDASSGEAPTLAGQTPSPAPPSQPLQHGSTHETVAPLSGSDESIPAEGVTFGDYELIEEIARGGMGIVFKARQRSLDRIVAIKMILSGQFASEDEIGRFNAESTAAAKLDHKNIVPIYESGVQGDNHYFSMKLIEGNDLGGQLKSLRSDIRSGVAIIEKVCRAIHHAHQRGILHRDLKPANILIDHAGEPYVTDLGLARQVGDDNQLTRTGAVVGTPSYMPPEQASGQGDITTAVDVYSLGAILYELLAGRPPFSGTNVMDTLMQVMHSEPQRPSMTGATDRSLELVALKCLSKNRADRYPTAEALADDLRRWANGEPVSIRSPSFSIVARSWFRQNFGHAIWILIVGLVAGCAAGSGLWFATIQQDMDEIRNVYKELPSVRAPLTLVPWSTPGWAVIPWMVVFTTALMFMGFFTASLARTKNRSADLAAGICVGIISSAAAFFICFGPLCVVAMNLNNSDMTKIVRASLDSTEDRTLAISDLFDDYPELETLSSADRANLLVRKLQADQLYQARNGIVTGTLCCLFLFLTAGIAETLVAGPIIRRCDNLGQAVGLYVFSSYTFVVATVVGGVYMTGIVVFGHPGIVWNLLTYVTIVVVSLGMLAEFRKWHVAIRATLVAGSGVVFWYFFAYSFMAMPVVAQANQEVKRRFYLAERYPDKTGLKSRAVDALLRYGVILHNRDYLRQAESCFIDAIEFIEAVPKEQTNDQIQAFWYTSLFNRANTLRRAGKSQDATELLYDAMEKRPNDHTLLRRAMLFFTSLNDTSAVTALVSQMRPASIEDWNAARDIVMLAFRDTPPEYLAAEFQRLLDASQFSPDEVAGLRASIEKTQKWYVFGPVANSDRAAVESQILNCKSVSDLSTVVNVGAYLLTRTLDLVGVDLVPMLGGEHENVSAFAVAIVRSDGDQSLDLSIGSDDFASVWVNGELLLEGKDEGREYKPRDDTVRCQLVRGTNAIVLRIDQKHGRWKFGVQVEDLQGWPIGLNWE